MRRCTDDARGVRGLPGLRVGALRVRISCSSSARDQKRNEEFVHTSIETIARRRQTLPHRAGADRHVPLLPGPTSAATANVRFMGESVGRTFDLSSS